MCDDNVRVRGSTDDHFHREKISRCMYSWMYLSSTLWILAIVYSPFASPAFLVLADSARPNPTNIHVSILRGFVVAFVNLPLPGVECRRQRASSRLTTGATALVRHPLVNRSFVTVARAPRASPVYTYIVKSWRRTILEILGTRKSHEISPITWNSS